jgi:hypothetical protein
VPDSPRKRAGWWFRKNVFDRRAASANARASCARYVTNIESVAASGAMPTWDESNTRNCVSALAPVPSGTA